MKKIITLSFALSLAMAPAYAFAQPATGIDAGRPPTGIEANGKTNPPAPVALSLTNPVAGVKSLSDLFYKILNFVVSLSYIVIAFFLLLSGFKFVTAQGSESKIEDAKKTFYWTIIGAVLIVGAQVITEAVKAILVQLK
jgi:hypothetical protein